MRKITGTIKRPRLSVFRSNKFVYVQAIDDSAGNTIAQANGKDPKEVGVKIADLLLKKKIKMATFDRGTYRYHGKIKIIADSAREKGLEF